MDEKNKNYLNVYCFECGEKLGHIGGIYQTDYEGNAICNNCMVTNEKGFVCAGCGCKCPETMRGGSGTFCINCEQIYDV